MTRSTHSFGISDINLMQFPCLIVSMYSGQCVFAISLCHMYSFKADVNKSCDRNRVFNKKTRFLLALCTFFLHEPPSKTKRCRSHGSYTCSTPQPHTEACNLFRRDDAVHTMLSFDSSLNLCNNWWLDKQ